MGGNVHYTTRAVILLYQAEDKRLSLGLIGAIAGADNESMCHSIPEVPGAGGGEGSPALQEAPISVLVPMTLFCPRDLHMHHMFHSQVHSWNFTPSPVFSEQ
ncbi:hypothetical protein J6590_039720 [Homalodisca vitripennis]|nr:hypothetical protein J6590_039720 [Homalodisca vitripennis]